MKRTRIAGLCLTWLYLMAVLGFDATVSASATEVLFQLSSGSFPATFTSNHLSPAVLLAANGDTVNCALTVSGTIGSTSEGTKNAHLGAVSLRFEGCTTLGGLVTCQSGGGAPGVIEVNNVTYHLGLADPGDVPALLLLIKTEFNCGGVTVKVGGSLIGTIAAKVNQPQSTLTLNFVQTNGIQEKTTFLLSLTTPENEIMPNQFLVATKGTAAGVQLGLLSTDTLLEFKNSSKQAAQILLVNG